MRREQLTPGICCNCGAQVEGAFVRCLPCVKEKLSRIDGRRQAVAKTGTQRKRTDAENRWRDAVSRTTRVAINSGLLPEPSQCACADCGRQAECFDHPDYNRPLHVVPVCIPCNSSRRCGVMPEVQTPESLRAAHSIGIERAA